MQLGELAETESALTITEQRLAVYAKPWPADVLAFHFCSSHPGTDTLNN